jgi:hypothetical protein
MNIDHFLVFPSTAVKIILTLEQRHGILLDVRSLRLRLELRNRVAQVQDKWPPLIDGEFASGRARLFLSVEDLEAIGPLFHILGFVDGVYRQLYRVVQHLWHELGDILVGRAQIRVGVDLDEPDPKIFIDQKIKSEKFPAVLPMVRIELLPDTEEGVNNNILNPLNKMLLNINIVFLKLLGEISLKISVAQSVSLLMLGIHFGLILQALVREVHIIVFS